MDYQNTMPPSPAQLTQEQLRQIMGGVTGDAGQAEMSLLDKQMAQAQALRHHAGPMPTTPGGALFGGLADVLNSYRGGQQEADTLARQRALIEQQRGGDADFAQRIQQRMNGGGQGGGFAPGAAPRYAPLQQPPFSLGMESA